MSKVWYRSKIIWTAIASAIALIGGYATGDISSEALITGLVVDVLLVIFRAWTTKAITLSVLLLACLLTVGCVMTETTKFQYVERVIVTVEPDGAASQPAKDTLCEVHIDMNAVDGTDQTQETKTDADVDAAVTGQGTAGVDGTPKD